MSAETIRDIVKEAKEDIVIPMPLQRPLSPPAPFPVDALGDILGPTVKKLQKLFRLLLEFVVKAFLQQ